jgi:hypothetical protein
MGQAVGGVYDPETLEVLQAALDDAWALLSSDKQASTSKIVLARRILRLAAFGERDPIRLRTGALVAVVAAAG